MLGNRKGVCECVWRILPVGGRIRLAMQRELRVVDNKETGMSGKNVVVGRGDLQAWAKSMRGNAYLEDTHFRRVLSFYAAPERLAGLKEDLERFGAEVAGPLD